MAERENPHDHIEVRSSSQHVVVVVDGVKVAESRAPMILFEASLPPRYYLPLTDLRTDLIVPSDRETRCPFKGTATYWSLEIDGRTYEDLFWTYRTPLPERQDIAGLVSFFNEKVDLYVDGVLQTSSR